MPRKEGPLSIVSSETKLFKEPNKLSIIPSGSSKRALTDYLNKVVGILSENSETKNTLKSLWGLLFKIFYSTSFNQFIAKWTFLNTTQEPVFIDLLNAFSANAKPSADPIAILVTIFLILYAYLLILLEGSKPGALEKKIGFFGPASYLTNTYILIF